MDASMNNLGKENLEKRVAGKGRIPGRRPGRDLLVVLCLSMLAISALPLLNRLIRDALIGQLVERVEQSPDDQVEVPIRQLAGFGLPAIDSLVAMGASSRVVPASVAREVVEQQMATWLIQSRALPTGERGNRQPVAISLRLSRLVEALARHIDSMDAEGRCWAQRITTQLLLHADLIAPAQSIQVLADCQTVLATALPGQARNQVPSPREKRFVDVPPPLEMAERRGGPQSRELLGTSAASKVK